MRVLVTGATGFIGSNLARELHRQGHEVFSTGTRGEQVLPEVRAQHLGSDFWALDWSEFAPVDVVFHQAAINDTTLLDREEMFRVNVQGAKALFEAAAAHGTPRMVYASSTALYGDAPAPYREDGPVHPLNPYAESKLLLDEMAAAFAREHPAVTIVGLRYCNVYGPGEGHKEKRASMIWQLAQQMRVRRPRIFQWGEQKRDYLWVGEAVRANLLAAASPESGVVNCGSGVATTFNDLIRLLNEALGTDWEPEYFENPYQGRYQDFTLCDMSNAHEKIGFVPAVDIREGIRRYAESGLLVPDRLPLAVGRTA